MIRTALIVLPAALAFAGCSSPTQDSSSDAGMLNAVEANVAATSDGGPPANALEAMPVEPVLPPPPSANASAAAPADPFVGRWTGPEGLYAVIAPGQAAGSYTVEMQYTLDDRGTFPATRQGNALVLTRGGETVRMVPGDGAATGMKWLDGERDCLVVIVGSEGYCRG